MLVRVKACSVCGTDIHIGLPHFCENLAALGVHTDGGFAGYSVVPESQLYNLPSNIPFDWGCFIEPISCAIHGIDLAGIKAGDNVVIIGTGTIGLIMIQLVRLHGAHKLIVAEPIKERRDIARRLNSDLVVDPIKENLKDVVYSNTYDGADVVIECAGTPKTTRSTFDLVKRGGTIIFFGVCDRDSTITIRPQEIYLKELTIIGSYINPNTFSRAINLLSLNKIDLTYFSIKKHSLDELFKAFKYHKERRYLKNVIVPNP